MQITAAPRRPVAAKIRLIHPNRNPDMVMPSFHNLCWKPSIREEHFKNKMRARRRRTRRGRVGKRKIIVESGPRGLAGGVIRPVAVEPGDTPFDALVIAGKAAILDDRVVNAA